MKARPVGRPRTTLLLAALGLFSLFSAFVTAFAADRAVLESKAFWEDANGNATYADAVDAPFQIFTGSLARGYTGSPVWLRLRLTGQDSSEPLAIVVRPAFLRNIELYDPRQQGGGQAPQPVFSGRDASIEQGNHIGLDNGFVIAASTTDHDVFLRITTNTTLAVDVNVVRLGEAERGSQVLAGTLSLYLAFLLAFCLWGLVSFAVHRDVLYGLFTLRLIYSALHIFVWFGLLKYFFSGQLSPATRDFIYCLVTITILPVTGLFDVRLLREFGAAAWLWKIYVAILSLPAVSLLLLLKGKTHLALQINAFVVSAAMLLIIPLALSVHDRDKKPYGKLAVTVIRMGYSLIGLVVFVPTLMYLNVISSKMSVLNVLFAHAVISTIVLFTILSIRARQRDVLARDAVLQYELKARELERENARRVEKERFLSMLTHELRNPLTVIRLMSGTDTSSGKAVQKAALDMAKVIERVELSEKISEEAARIQKAPLDLDRFFDGLLNEHALTNRTDVSIAPDLRIVTDEAILSSVLRNLLDNAEKYSVATSRIRVSAVAVREHGVTLTVTNDVGDVEVPDAERVFTKYYRAHGAHRQPGSGLGLFLVASWVKALGGSIDYRHERHPEGRVSVSFIIWLPA